MITKFKLFEDWEIGTPEVGDWVVLIRKDASKLPEYAVRYLQKQKMFQIENVRKKDSGAYVIDIGCRNKENGEVYNFLFDGFALVPSPGSKNDPFDNIDRFSNKVNTITTTLNEIYNEISSIEDKFEIYDKADDETAGELFITHVRLVLDCWSKYMELLHLYISNEIPFDDLCKDYAKNIIASYTLAIEFMKDRKINLQESDTKRLKRQIPMMMRIKAMFQQKGKKE